MTKNNDLKTIWKAVLSELEISVSKPVFKTLFSQTFLISLSEKTAQIAIPNPVVKQMIKTRYEQLLINALQKQTNSTLSLDFQIKDPPHPKKNDLGPLFKTQDTTDSNPHHPQDPQKFGLNSNYTFQTLVVGNSNNFAHAAAQAIVENPGHAYNPFFVYGGVGVGKTHLIQAIGHAILSKNPSAKILYVSSETFTNELVRALQQKTITSFKNKYRHPFCLIVDDIQFISGKEYSQEEFFHTFNALHMAGRQIIITSDRKPEEIPQVEERLTSRFLGGLAVDVQPPDYEMRIGILKEKCSQLKTTLDQQSLELIAAKITTNVRYLEGALLQILSQSKAKGQQPDISFIKQFLGDKAQPNQSLSPNQIISSVSKYFSVKRQDLIGKSRKAQIVLPRQILMYLLRTELNIPLKKVGDILGGRDHTTIIHGHDKISKQYPENSKLRQQIIHIKQNIS